MQCQLSPIVTHYVRWNDWLLHLMLTDRFRANLMPYVFPVGLLLSWFRVVWPRHNTSYKQNTQQVWVNKHNLYAIDTRYSQDVFHIGQTHSASFFICTLPFRWIIVQCDIYLDVLHVKLSQRLKILGGKMWQLHEEKWITMCNKINTDFTFMCMYM